MSIVNDSLSLDDITADPGVQSRACIDTETVEQYAIDMRLGDIFEAVDVFHDGMTYWLADGFHRYEAAKLAPVPCLRATVHTGGRRDAILHSVSSNQKHGLRRSNADKRHSVMKLLQDEMWGQWSDREIARRTGVSQPFVSSLRASDNGYRTEADQVRKFERGGKVHTMNTSNIGGKQESAEASEALFEAIADDGPQTTDELNPQPETRNRSEGAEPPPRQRLSAEEIERKSRKVVTRHFRIGAVTKLIEKYDDAVFLTIYRDLVKLYHPDKRGQQPPEIQQRQKEAYRLISTMKTLWGCPNEKFDDVARAEGLFEEK